MKLLKAESLEQVKELLSGTVSEEDAARIWKELEMHRPSAKKTSLDDGELDSVAGGISMRSFRREGCAASVEQGSWCLSNDFCVMLEVMYDYS